MSTPTPPPGYHLAHGPPGVEDYLRLRERARLSPGREDRARAALAGGWAAVHVVHETDGAVGTARVVGDGGSYLHIVDMAVLPRHRRRGLGDLILATMLEQIRAAAPPGAYVNLLADEPGRPLYRKHGFRATAPASIGMARWLY